MTKEEMREHIKERSETIKDELSGVLSKCKLMDLSFGALIIMCAESDNGDGYHTQIAHVADGKATLSLFQAVDDWKGGLAKSEPELMMCAALQNLIGTMMESDIDGKSTLTPEDLIKGLGGNKAENESDD